MDLLILLTYNFCPDMSLDSRRCRRTMSESQCSISSIEMTKNPFESDLEDKLNYPGFSPSMFTPRTPVNRKEKEFRWSIEQISRLYPVDIDEFPNQEYSSTFERDEDEKAAQDAIKEYFSQDAIVPSPWTPNHSAKHVTFSPLPPDTQYIASECSMDSSFSSQNNSIRTGRVEAGTQTTLSLPWNVNLEEILGSAFQTFMHNDLDDSKDNSSSSLRRNLFPHNGQTEEKTDNNNNQQNVKIRSILKASKSPSLTTSSPVKSKQTKLKEQRRTHLSTPCPDVSPIRSGNVTTPLKRLKSSRLSIGQALYSPMKTATCTDVLESSGIEKDLEMFPDISPIKDDQVEHESDNKQTEEKPHKELESNNHESHCPEVKPLKMSALEIHNDKVNDINDDENDDSKSGNDSDDSEKPAKITMEDLANESGICDVQEFDEVPLVKKPPGVSMDDLKSPNDISMMKDTDIDDTEAMETSMSNVLSSTHIPEKYIQHEKEDIYFNEEQGIITTDDSFVLEKRPAIRDRLEMRDIKRTYDQLDDNMVMIKAAAAIRRANRFSQKNCEAEYGFHSKSENYSISRINVSELPWQPVSMSTPLTTPPMRPRAYGSSFDHEYERFDPKTQFGNTSNNVFLGNKESEVFRTSYYDNRICHSRNGTKKLSPVMEDVLRRREILKNSLKEVQSNDWNSVTPTYKSPLAGKRRTARTYPLNYTDRKTLYGCPSYRIHDYVDMYSPQLFTNTRFDSKRTSWPPSRTFSLRLHEGIRPLSPIYWPSASKVNSNNPEGCASRMPLPAPYTHSDIDSGFDEWKKSINRWEKSMKIPNVKLNTFY